MQYSEKVMEHFANPRNAGVLDDPDAVGEVGNPRCGDIMKITLQIDDDSETIEDIRFQTFGCGAAIAVSSIFTEMVKGKTLREALQIGNDDVVKELGGLPNVKVHCSVLAEEGMAVAIKSYYDAHPDKQPPEGLEEKIAHLKSIDPHADEH
ncbi:MAG TPA: iron-sulfur cluster assembly scaffold protein [Armatimonadota bacterium]|nr:iron-sulfur cluster assembly scaffold protein [Armatimonadota bacterium]